MEGEETTVAQNVQRLEARAMSSGLDLRGHLGTSSSRNGPERTRGSSRTPPRLQPAMGQPPAIEPTAVPGIDEAGAVELTSGVAQISLDETMPLAGECLGSTRRVNLSITPDFAPQAERPDILQRRMCVDGMPHVGRDSRGLL